MSSNLTISFELIYLMGWLLQHEKGTLEQLVKKAIDNGLDHELNKIDQEDHAKLNEHLYTTILDFLLFFEETLLDQLAQTDGTTTQKELTPALKKLDGESLSARTIWNSIQDVQYELNKQGTKANPSVLKKISADEKTSQDAKKVLFKMLLKNWKPENKEPVN